MNDKRFVVYENLTIFFKLNNLETYPPSEDSFLLANHVKRFVKNKKVLDLGCGSGIQGLVAKKYGASEITFSDIDENAIIISKYNYLYNFVNKNIDLNNIKNIKTDVNFIKSDLFSSIKEKYDVIIFNPPYLPKIDKEDENVSKWITGGKEGCELIIKFLNQAINHINKNSIILLVYSSLSKPEKIEKYAKNLGFNIEILDEERFFFEKLYIVMLSIK